MDFVTEAVRQNSQWQTGRVVMPRIIGYEIKRPIFRDLLQSWKRKFITVIRGLRRTGKSVLARQLMRHIMETDATKNVAWFEFDRAMNPTPDDLDALIRYFESLKNQTIFLDEIAFVPKWQDILKRFYDRTNIKFVITGSSALELDRRTSESLAGRFNTLYVSPFSLPEVLDLAGKPSDLSPLDLATRSEELYLDAENYLKTGGLPENALEKTDSVRNQYIKDSLLSPLFYKDLPAVFSQAKPDLLSKTLEVLAGTVPNTYQAQTLASVLGCSTAQASQHVDLLEKGLLVKTVFNYTPSLAKQKRTSKKIVFADNGILSALRPDTPIGGLAETAVQNAFSADFFWKNPLSEVDLVFPGLKLAVEVKYQEHVTKSDERHLRYFLERRNDWKGLLITKKDDLPDADIPYLPLWKVLMVPSLALRKTV